MKGVAPTLLHDYRMHVLYYKPSCTLTVTRRCPRANFGNCTTHATRLLRGPSWFPELYRSVAIEWEP